MEIDVSGEKAMSTKNQYKPLLSEGVMENLSETDDTGFLTFSEFLAEDAALASALKRSRAFRARKSKLLRGRKLMAKRRRSTDQLKKAASARAMNALLKKLSGSSPNEIPLSQKVKLKKRINSTYKSKLEALTKIIFNKIRRQEANKLKKAKGDD
jgi:hypothetical protein